jgi:hypothetical protein
MMKKNILTTFCFAFLSVQAWASADIPVDQPIDGPPDTVPIDNYLPWALFIMVIMIGYYFNKRAKTLLKNK